MKKTFVLAFILFIAIKVFPQSGSYPGAFSRMGFGTRGLSMGNALVSNIYGNVASYYNPSLSAFQEQGFANIGYTFLSLDRKLNFIGVEKKFRLPNQKEGGAGISFYWINSGVGDIDTRDNDTKQLGYISTYENLFGLGTSFLLNEELAIGLGFKLYYSKLYEGIKSTSFGLDIGMIYKIIPDLTVGLSLKDFLSKYKWETNSIYGVLGTTTENKFPVIMSIGTSYNLPKQFGSVSVQFDTYFNPKFQTKDTSGVITYSKREYNYYLKVGGELKLVQNFYLRAGVDRIDITSDDFWGNIKPGFGVSFFRKLTKKYTLGLEYSFQLEPYTHEPIQNIGVGFLLN